jgi:hypothetical protein
MFLKCICIYESRSFEGQEREVIGDRWKIYSWYCTPDSIRRKNRAYGMRGIGWKCMYNLTVKHEMKRPLGKNGYILQNCIQM